MAYEGERFMRMWAQRWLEDNRIRGGGDDGQRTAGLSLEQEAVYLRLCLTQFLSEDGYLPNRRAFLTDAVACPIASYEALVEPVLQTFFKKARNGMWFNSRTRAEWEHANAKSLQTRRAAEVKWEKKKAEFASAGASGDASASTDKIRQDKKHISADLGSGGAKAPQRPGAVERAAIDELAKRFVEALCWLFSRNGKPRSWRAGAGVVDAITKAVAAGYEADLVACIPWLAHQHEWTRRAFESDDPPDPTLLLRFKGGMNGATGKEAGRWLETLPGVASQVELYGNKLKLAQRLGVVDALVKAGARVRDTE